MNLKIFDDPLFDNSQIIALLLFWDNKNKIVNEEEKIIF